MHGIEHDTIGARERRIPAFSAAAWPRTALVRTSSTGTSRRARRGRSARRPSRARSGRPSATRTTSTPAGRRGGRRRRVRGASRRVREATRITMRGRAHGCLVEPARHGVAAPYRISPPTSTSTAAGSSRNDVPESTTRQPAASISARSASAVAQSRAARASARRLAASPTFAGTALVMPGPRRSRDWRAFLGPRAA